MPRRPSRAPLDQYQNILSKERGRVPGVMSERPAPPSPATEPMIRYGEQPTQPYVDPVELTATPGGPAGDLGRVADYLEENVPAWAGGEGTEDTSYWEDILGVGSPLSGAPESLREAGGLMSDPKITKGQLAVGTAGIALTYLLRKGGKVKKLVSKLVSGKGGKRGRRKVAQELREKLGKDMPANVSKGLDEIVEEGGSGWGRKLAAGGAALGFAGYIAEDVVTSGRNVLHELGAPIEHSSTKATRRQLENQALIREAQKEQEESLTETIKKEIDPAQRLEAQKQWRAEQLDRINQRQAQTQQFLALQSQNESIRNQSMYQIMKSLE